MANVIFIEQPAGVGFSYSQDTDDYNVGDFQAAEDVYHFLVNFVARYPQYANRKLYLSGESYGGHCAYLGGADALGAPLLHSSHCPPWVRPPWVWP